MKTHSVARIVRIIALEKIHMVVSEKKSKKKGAWFQIPSLPKKNFLEVVSVAFLSSDIRS